MTKETEELLRNIMKLPPEARAAIAGSLVESLDEHVDEAAERAWASEIVARVAALDEGAVESVPWFEARRRISGT